MTAQRNSVLVTGGAGFIGSALVERLVRDGEHVVVVDNLVNGKRANLAHLPAGGVRLIIADVRRPQDFEAELQAARTVFHLACLGVRHSLHSPAENRDVNEGGTQRMLEAAHAAGVSRFIYVSTSEVYGSAQTSPMSEDHPTRPTTVYGAAKLAGESQARSFHDAGAMAVTVVRPFNAYGPRCHHEGDAGEVVPKFVLRALERLPLVVFGDGQQTRDFTYVEDTAAAIADISRCDRAVGQTINFGSGIARSILDVAHEAGRAAGHGVQIIHDAPRPGDVRTLCADATRAARLIGYRPTVEFADGLDRLVAWYRGSGVAPGILLAEEIDRNWLPPSPVRHVG